MTTTSTPISGTVKVGRWEYPARATHTATGFENVERNTKRDGSGDWEPVAATFEPAADTVYHDAPAEPTQDYWDLRKAYGAIFGSFALTMPSEVAEVLGSDNARAFAIADHLDRVGLTVQDTVSGGSRVIQSQQTYDYITAAEAMADFDEKVPVTVKVAKVAKAHGSKPGAQTKKPGKSQWRIGDLCPQGTHILDEHALYTMPSGRKQCRGCRKGYPSNAPAKA